MRAIYVVVELCVMLLIMWRCVVAHMECRAMRILPARRLYKVWLFNKITKKILFLTTTKETLAYPHSKSAKISNFIEDPVPNACIPSPCGPNSQCRDINSQAICSCLPGYYGEAPYCKPECLSTSDCPLTKTCVNLKCVDPCAGACGLHANCKVINHNTVCYCSDRYTGDPFNRCTPVAIGIKKSLQFESEFKIVLLWNLIDSLLCRPYPLLAFWLNSFPIISYPASSSNARWT